MAINGPSRSGNALMKLADYRLGIPESLEIENGDAVFRYGTHYALLPANHSDRLTFLKHGPKEGDVANFVKGNELGMVSGLFCPHAGLNAAPLMKTLACWFLLGGLLFADPTVEEQAFYATYAESEAKALASYPAAADPESPLTKRMVELDQAAKAAGDPLFHSPDKPFLLAEKAAAELKILPAGPKPALDVTAIQSDEWHAAKREAWQRTAKKFPDAAIRSSSFRQRMREFDAVAKEQYPDIYLNPEKPMIYAEMVQIERDQQKADEAARQPTPTPPPVWRMYVQNKAFQEANREAINRERDSVGLQPLPVEGERRPILAPDVSPRRSFRFGTEGGRTTLIPSDGGETIVIDEANGTARVGGSTDYTVSRDGANVVLQPTGRGRAIVIDTDSGVASER